MKRIRYRQILIFTILFGLLVSCGQKKETTVKTSVAISDYATPWTFWYWMHGAVSKAGITADLEAMKQAGIGGTYLFAIRDTLSDLYPESVVTMSPEWWQMVKFAAGEADRLGLKMGFNSCDGFTCAGGPWITPDMSMQKVVWADTIISGEQLFNKKLPQPEKVKNYYQDIAVFAYPAPDGAGESSWKIKPVVSSNLTSESLQYLAEEENTRQFSTKRKGWIQYAFEEPFSCRSVRIKTGWNNYQSNRLIIETSDDGIHFKFHTRVLPPRSGWLDLDQPNTQNVEPASAKYFRFVFDPEGSEPGAEDLDDAKWMPTLRLKGIELFGEAKINQFEGKNGSIWRVAAQSNEKYLPVNECIDPEAMINISEHLAVDGKLNWKVPEGKWVILRMGHTSTGHENYVGGGGKGLECDKFDPAVVRFQLDQWFGEAFRQIGEKLASKVIKRFHVDSWECGSQNWSKVMLEEFQKRRGYDLMNYLPVMAGVPLQSAETSERVLQDIRQTIEELFAENFYRTLQEEAHKRGVLFSAESMAPVGVGDGMLHFKYVDFPMGEYWFRSPSHDKPNDILDAISGAHIYGKQVVQAESFTEIRLDWDETPAMLKSLADRNFALGINKVFAHVFIHNPWTDRMPGMTLDKVGTFLQRDQVWWKQSSAFWKYLHRCQQLLQEGRPVVDLAVFTGEEIPRRAVLPDRLIGFLPGIMGKDRVDSEKKRLVNEGAPKRVMPQGVTTQANMADPEKWIDPLNGYSYDSFNADALLNLATVKDGRIVLPGGSDYAALVIPGNRKLSPNGGEQMSLPVANKLDELIRQGATVLWMEKPVHTIGLEESEENTVLQKLIANLFDGEKVSYVDENGFQFEGIQKEKGRIIEGQYLAKSFSPLGVDKDFVARNGDKLLHGKLAWNHRQDREKDIYFISNQSGKNLHAEMSFRVEGKVPVIYNAVSGDTLPCRQWNSGGGRTNLAYEFSVDESVFVLFYPINKDVRNGTSNNITLAEICKIEGPWTLIFDPQYGGPTKPVVMKNLADWTENADERIRFYSGVATYKTLFDFKETADQQNLWIDLGDFANIAEVRLNGESVGICWTLPHRFRLDGHLKKGENKLEIDVVNTWNNRLIGDHRLSEEKCISWTTAPYRLEGRPLLPAGLLGPVTIRKNAR